MDVGYCAPESHTRPSGLLGAWERPLSSIHTANAPRRRRCGLQLLIPDYVGYVDVPRGAVGRVIGKAGANIKLIQKRSNALRIGFDDQAAGVIEA